MGKTALSRREQLGIKTRSITRPVRLLSGGNQQKVVVAKWLETKAQVLFFDEPGLTAFRDGGAPIDRERATDLLSGALAAPTCVVGVHVCGAGDLRIALDAGPKILGVEVGASSRDIRLRGDVTIPG